MRLTEFAVRNPAFMLVAFGLLVAIGVSSWQQIPRTEDPVFDISAYRVIAVYPGADALEVERRLVEPIEDALNTLDDVKLIAGSADDSTSCVHTASGSAQLRSPSSTASACRRASAVVAVAKAWQAASTEATVNVADAAIVGASRELEICAAAARCQSDSCTRYRATAWPRWRRCSDGTAWPM